ncbi:hypothetical protein HDV05_001798 [Chytridiales sp. JEL 0842]|nr:hypothetical protein HDV05_001798 [Chytridiales sp. JEL 0842]
MAGDENQRNNDVLESTDSSEVQSTKSFRDKLMTDSQIIDVDVQRSAPMLDNKEENEAEEKEEDFKNNNVKASQNLSLIRVRSTFVRFPAALQNKKTMFKNWDNGELLVYKNDDCPTIIFHSNQSDLESILLLGPGISKFDANLVFLHDDHIIELKVQSRELHTFYIDALDNSKNTQLLEFLKSVSTKEKSANT